MSSLAPPSSAAPGSLPPRTEEEVADDRLLARLGYQRRFFRKLGPADNAFSAFSVISVITGVCAGFALGMNAGGPRTLVWGWILVSVMTLVVGFAMAEICGAMPTSGALYYWSSRLAPSKVAARRSWTTAHLNLIGLVAGTSAVAYTAAVFIGALGGVLDGYTVTADRTFVLFVVLMLVFGLVNSFQVQVVMLLNRISALWLVGGTVVLVAVLGSSHGPHQSVGYALSHAVNNTGFHNGWYAGAVGLLVAGFTYCGFDASAHLSEDTRDAARSAPRGIVRSIMWSAPVGLLLILALVWNIRSYAAEVGAAEPTAQIMYDSVGRWGQILLLVIAIGAMLLCAISGVQANSRMAYAVSRDGILPGSRLWAQVSDRTHTPIKAVWLAVGLSLALGIPALFSTVVFNAVASINVIGVFSAYGIPIFYRARQGRAFERGEHWNLGERGQVVAWVAVGWIVVMDVLFVLPETSPITTSTFNFAGPVLVVVLVISAVWWRVSGRDRYQGPVRMVSPEEAMALGEGDTL